MYKVPSMKEVYESSNRNLFTVISTFAGCGGSSTGYRMAGGKVLVANEFIPAAIECYKANYPDTKILSDDIRKLKGSDFLEQAKINIGELDIFDGSPPCASFSMAGTRDKSWGKVKTYSDTKQRVDDLFFEYARILKEIQPKVFVAENVKGLTLGVAKDVLGSYQIDMFKNEDNTIINILRDCGYNVKYHVLNAKHYGVPQSRQRIIFIGVRKDFDVEPSFPERQSNIITLRDAIGDIQIILAKGFNEEEHRIVTSDMPCVTINADGLGPSRRYRVERETEIKNKTLEIVKKLKPGQSGADVMNGSYFSLKRLERDKPTGTLQQSEAKMPSTNMVHPDENRKLSICELKRIQSFPDDFILTGSFTQQWERLGRSVPPLMMKAIAENIYIRILCKIKNENPKGAWYE